MAHIFKVFIFIFMLFSSISYSWWLNFDNRSSYMITATIHFSHSSSPKTTVIAASSSPSFLIEQGCVERIEMDAVETKGTSIEKRQHLTFTPTQTTAANDRCMNYHVYIERASYDAPLTARSTMP